MRFFFARDSNDNIIGSVFAAINNPWHEPYTHVKPRAINFFRGYLNLHKVKSGILEWASKVGLAQICYQK